MAPLQGCERQPPPKAFSNCQRRVHTITLKSGAIADSCVLLQTHAPIYICSMRFVRSFFFGNYFYGLCAVGLAVEANLQQGVALNSPLYYLATFCATVFFYTAAYVTDYPVQTGNGRSAWYYNNRHLVKTTQALFLAVAMLYAVWFAWRNWQAITHLSFSTFLLLALFPLSGLLYYGLSGKGIAHYTLRRIGWLKPFAIGFTWAGWVTVFPAVASGIEHGTVYQPTLFGTLLFIKNLMFVTVLCILFDVKDYAADHNLRIKTFVVTYGLRRTIFLIVLPLSLVGFGVFLFYAFTHHFHPLRIALNAVPFFALMAVAYSMHRRRSIFYYLAVIDGLMLVKAVCGSVAAVFF